MATESVNTTTLPRRGDGKIFLALVVAAAALAGAGTWFVPGLLAHRDVPLFALPDQPRALAEFSLTNSLGQVVTRADLDGKILAVSFLFTSCSLTCREVSRQMAEIQRRTAADPDVRLVSLTVDPRTDTPSVLAKWARRFGADTGRWLFLTGDTAVEHRLIAESFLNTAPDEPFNYMPGNFTDTDRIVLVDRHGRIRAYFDGLSDQAPAAVVKEIARLRAEN